VLFHAKISVQSSIAENARPVNPAQKNFKRVLLIRKKIFLNKTSFNNSYLVTEICINNEQQGVQISSTQIFVSSFFIRYNKEKKQKLQI
jgi:hypothetical protein